jgi:transposase
MPMTTYSSSLTDAEWAILEPLLPDILPPKHQTRPLEWSYREIIDGILYRLKNGCNWADLPKDLPPYSTVYWHYKQWRVAGTGLVHFWPFSGNTRSTK